MRAALLPLTAVLFLCAVAPQVAAAEEPGVHVDPDSPSGKEYAIPLDRARSDTGGSKNSDSESSSDGRFGSGIEPAAGAQPNQDAPSSSQSTGQSTTDEPAPSAGRRKTKQKRRRLELEPTAAPATGGTDSSKLGIGLIGLGVLAVGGLLGLLLRGGLRRDA
jgi:hypothetical protein